MKERTVAEIKEELAPIKDLLTYRLSELLITQAAYTAADRNYMKVKELYDHLDRKLTVAEKRVKQISYAKGGYKKKERTSAEEFELALKKLNREEQQVFFQTLLASMS